MSDDFPLTSSCAVVSFDVTEGGEIRNTHRSTDSYISLLYHRYDLKESINLTKHLCTSILFDMIMYTHNIHTYIHTYSLYRIHK
jgi:hypothetical protein